MKAETRFMSFSVPGDPDRTKPMAKENTTGHSAQAFSLLRVEENLYDPTDAECLDLIVCEDQAAFRKLFEKYYKELFCFARRYVQSPDACKDILQDVFSYFWEKRAQLEIHQSVKAYLYRAIHHRCVNYLKKIDNDNRHLNNFHIQQNFVNPMQPDALNQMQEKELMATIERAIGELPEQCRKIFTLSRKEGLQHKEIARQLSISPKTVEVQIYRALKYLKQQLSVSEKRN